MEKRCEGGWHCPHTCHFERLREFNTQFPSPKAEDPTKSKIPSEALQNSFRVQQVYISILPPLSFKEERLEDLLTLLKADQEL